MKKKKTELLRLEGVSVILDEIQPKYFPYVIQWRNDKELNRYLNQPYVLTLENQTKWYEEKYLKDSTQGFMVVVDKKTNTPFATLGWTDMDLDKRVCIMGRLILGNSDYANTPVFLEGFILLGDYVYSLVDIAYIHVGVENHKALRLNKRFGFLPNEGVVHYPHELIVNGDPKRKQIELYRTKEMYKAVRKKMFEDIQDELFSEYR